MIRDMMERLIDALELANKNTEKSDGVVEDIKEINQHLDSIDRVLRGHENTAGLVSRVTALEKTNNMLRVLVGAVAGAFVTLLAAYIGRGRIP